MAARKKAARRGKAKGGDGGGLWAPKLGLVSLRLFVGLVFLSVSHHKLIAPLETRDPVTQEVIERDLSLGERIEVFAENDLVPRVENAKANPPYIFGWELRWFTDLLAAVTLPGKAPYIFGTLILVFELLLGIALVLGVCTRLMAFLGAWLMLVFGLVKAVPFLTVTKGTNWYLVMILFALALTAAGRIWGLDAKLQHRFPRWIS